MSRFPVLARFCLTAAVATAAPPAAAAGPAVPPSPETAGLFFRSDNADKLFAAPVLASEVVIDIAGDIARVTVTQRFRNPSQVWLEGIYVYPLPERAAVDRLTLRIGGRVIEGRILEREAAQQAYQAALMAGKRASLLSSARPNVFSTHVANIGPGEEIAILIGYQHQARFDDGERRYRFPLVVAPRYTPSAELPLVAVPSSEGGESRPFVREITHRADAAATVPARDLFGPVRDPGNDSDGSASTRSRSPSASMPACRSPASRRPTMKSTSAPLQRDLALVIDKSGSMHAVAPGGPLRYAVFGEAVTPAARNAPPARHAANSGTGRPG